MRYRVRCWRALWSHRALPFSLALFAALLPTWAFAGSCNGGYIPDVGACVDATNYNVWKGLAVLGWNANRLLLIGAYQLDQWRWWLVQNVFLSVYNAIASFVGPLIAPVATLAMLLALLCVLLLPLTGRVQALNIRQILVLLMLAPLLLAQSGPWLIDVEQARTQTVASILGGVSTSVPPSLFGPAATDTDMLPASPLYPASCGGTALVRGGPGNTVMGLDDAAAAVLWATAIDIHCPQQAGSEHPELPSRWTEPKPSGADYAYNGDLGDVDNAQLRADYIAKIQAGTTRAVLALLPSLLALTQRLIDLLFALGLIVVWLALPIAFLTAFFQQTYAGLTRLAAGALQVFKVSVVVSVLLDILVVSSDRCDLLAQRSGLHRLRGGGAAADDLVRGCGALNPQREPAHPQSDGAGCQRPVACCSDRGGLRRSDGHAGRGRGSAHRRGVAGDVGDGRPAADRQWALRRRGGPGTHPTGDGRGDWGRAGLPRR